MHTLSIWLRIDIQIIFLQIIWLHIDIAIHDTKWNEGTTTKGWFTCHTATCVLSSALIGLMLHGFRSKHECMRGWLERA